MVKGYRWLKPLSTRLEAWNPAEWTKACEPNLPPADFLGVGKLLFGFLPQVAQHREPQLGDVRDQSLVPRGASGSSLRGELLDLSEERRDRTERQPDHGTIRRSVSAGDHAQQFRARRVEALDSEFVGRLIGPGLNGQRKAVGRDLGIDSR
jgi:hypothetical protein